jgi:hypothetical protein
MPNSNDVDRYAKLAMLPGLEAARDRIAQQILEIRSAVWPEGRQAATKISSAPNGRRGRKKGHLSAAGRKRLSELMKARWAERRGPTGKKAKRG